MKRILRSDWARNTLCWLIAWYIRLVYRTSRFEVQGGTVPAALWDAGKPFILAFWHGRLLMAPKAWRPGMSMNMLISGHGDGRLIAGAIRHFGLGTITGSRSKGGAGALRAMLKALAAGQNIGVTPDGPHGPAFEATVGIIAAARLSGAPIVPLTYATTRRRVLGSWDRFHLALPFSRGVFVWGQPVSVAPDADQATMEVARRMLEDRLNLLTDTADLACNNDPVRALPPASRPPRRWDLKTLYRLGTTAAGPFARLVLLRRASSGKEDRTRLGERWGRTDLVRRPGPLVWLHAASIGESLSLVPLVERIIADRPGTNVLVTTGTVTSAAMMAERLPGFGARHQYAPLDHPAAVRRFLNHWKPDLAVWVESELWPNLIFETHRRGIKMALLNGRMSERSWRGWKRVPSLIREMLGAFDLVLGQDGNQALRLKDLGATGAETVGDLKAALTAPAADPATLDILRAAIGGRPTWLAASTHPGEEPIIAAAHKILKRWIPDLLTIVAPRHPVRAKEITTLLRVAGLDVARRSLEEVPAENTDIWLIDTLGELGLFYRLAPIVLVAGSLGPAGSVGGHNPLEAASLGCALLHGPDTVNCAASMASLDKAGAAREVTDAPTLATTLDGLFHEPARCREMGDAARRVAEAERHVVDTVFARLAPLLPAAETIPDRVSA